MSLKRLAAAAVLIVMGLATLYTIEGAVSTVWGVALYPEMPLTVKLLLPGLAVGFAIVMIGMLRARLRRNTSKSDGDSEERSRRSSV